MYGRSDVGHYAHGAKELRNMIVNIQGQATRRMGGQFVEEQNIGFERRFVPFTFSESETSLLLFTENSNAVTVYNGDTYANEGNFFLPGGATFDATDLSEFQYAQSGDELWITHKDKEPIIITRTASQTFSAAFLFSASGRDSFEQAFGVPYRDVNTNTSHTLTASAVSGSGITITSSVSFFDANHVGAYFKMSGNVNPRTGIVRITNVSNPTTATADVILNLDSTSATSDWEESAWSDFRGWPRTVSFFQERICFGGNISEPDTIWFSRVGNFLEMHTDNEVNFLQSSDALTVADAKNFTLSSPKVDQIQWMMPGERLAIGTLGTEYTLQDVNADTPLVKEQTSHGSFYRQAEKIAKYVLFITAAQNKIREFVFDFDTDSFNATDIMLLSEHLYRRYHNQYFSDIGSIGSSAPLPKIKKISYQESENILWVIDEEGGLFSLTREPQQQVAAWSHHIMGGTLDESVALGGSPGDIFVEPKVRDIQVLKNPSGYDDLWILVERTIDGTNEYHVEVISPVFTDDQNYSRAFFVDSAKFVSGGAGANIFAGFSHLANTEVEVLDVGRGKKITGLTVNGSGQITLPNGLTSNGIIAGLGYTSRIKTLPLQDGSYIGSAQGQFKRPDKTHIRYYNTRGLKVGRENGDLDTILLNDNTLANSAKQPTVTGEATVEFPRGYDKEAVVQIENDGPLPLTVTNLTTRYTTYEG